MDEETQTTDTLEQNILDDTLEIQPSEEEITYQETVTQTVDYTQPLDNIVTIGLFMIIFIGVLTGLISSKIMWGRIHV